MESFCIDEVGADVAGDDRLLVMFGDVGEELGEVVVAECGETVGEEGLDEGICGIVGQFNLVEGVEELVGELVDPFGDCI